MRAGAPVSLPSPVLVGGSPAVGIAVPTRRTLPAPAPRQGRGARRAGPARRRARRTAPARTWSRGPGDQPCGDPPVGYLLGQVEGAARVVVPSVVVDRAGADGDGDQTRRVHCI